MNRKCRCYTCLLLHLPAKFKMIDEIFVLYKNSNKYFNSYQNAYFNSIKPGSTKEIKYVFTPTMQECKNVSELENVCRKYFNQAYDCDYLDIITHERTKQMRLEI